MKTENNQIAITCRICEKFVIVKSLTNHLRTHAMKFYDYVDTYFEDFVEFGYERCYHCNVGIARRYKCQKKERSFCSRECDSAWRREFMTGKPGRGLGYKFTPDQILNSKKAKFNHPGVPHTNETKRKMSNLAFARAQLPNYVNPMQGKTHTPEAIKKIFDKRKLNKFELSIASVLNSNNIEFIYQFFLSRDGTCYSYDFHITGTNVLLEADGDYWHGGPGVKKYHANVESTKDNDDKKSTFASDHGYKVIRVWESEMKKDPSILLSRLS